jgi:hypothetical protein
MVRMMGMRNDVVEKQITLPFSPLPPVEEVVDPVLRKRALNLDRLRSEGDLER